MRSTRPAGGSPDATVYRIAPGRGYEQAASVLGEEFAGVIERDGWVPYRRCERARHQSCLAHLLRRCREMIAESERGQARVPHALRRILLAALALRDRRQAGLIDAQAFARELEALEAGIDRLSPAGSPTRPAAGCSRTSATSAPTCSPSSPPPASRPRAGGPSRRCARQS